MSTVAVTAITDFKLGSSGYASICAPLFMELASRGYDMTVLGIAYDGSQHNFPYRVVPVSRNTYIDQTRAMVHNLMHEGGYADHLLVAMDLLVQEKLLPTLKTYGKPYTAIFPVEAPPLGRKWANLCKEMTHRLPMSRFAVEECLRHSMDAEYLPVTVDTASWRPPAPDEREVLRGAMGIDPKDKVVFMVADNQERKNLPAAFRAVSLARKAGSLYFILVTRLDSPVGWDVEGLKERYEVADVTMDFQRGLEFKRLWSLAAMADVALFTSKAEGVCMPVLEAMSMGVPVVAPEHTSFVEHLAEGRGLLCRNAFVDEGPYGNEYRYYVDPDDTAAKLIHVLFEMDESARCELIAKARAYVESRTWKEAADVIAKHLS